MPSKDQLAYRVIWSTDDQKYASFCAELPALRCMGTTRWEALEKIRSAAAVEIRRLRRESEPVPKPFQARRYSGKLTVRMPPELHRSLATQAAEKGVSLNRLVNEKLKQ